MKRRHAGLNLICRLVASLLIGGLPQTGRGQTCPQNCLPVVGCSSAPSARFYIPATHGTGDSGGSYNLGYGLLQCSGYWSYADIATTDWFVVESAPSAAPFSLAIEMHFTSGLYYALADGRVTVPGLGEMVQRCETPDGYGGCDETKSFSFSIALGDTFTVNAECLGTNTGFYGSYSVDLVYSLRDIPPGVVIRSCQGYVFDTVVPTRAVSWGRLKRYYR